jgi:hypothetical protein
LVRKAFTSFFVSFFGIVVSGGTVVSLAVGRV